MSIIYTQEYYKIKNKYNLKVNTIILQNSVTNYGTDVLVFFD